MTDKISKLLQRLSKKDLDRITLVLKKIKKGQLEGLDIKALKTNKSKFRVRVGRYRIIFDKRDGKIAVLSVDKRDEKTYKGF